MNPVGRAVLAALAVLMVWSLVRTLRTGRIFSEMRAYSLDEQPFLFSLTAGVHFVGIFYFAWLAAGGDAATFYRWMLSQ